MASIRAIPGIQENEANILKGLGIKTQEAFWEQLGVNRPENIDKLADKTHGAISANRLVVLYSSALFREAKRSSPWLGRALSLLILFIALILYFNPALFFRAFFLSALFPQQVNAQVIASPAGGLKAHTILQAKDLEMIQLAGDPLAFQDPKKVIGGYLLKDLNPGQVIHPTDFVPAQDMAGRQIVSLVVAAGSLGNPLKPGKHVSLRLEPNPDKKGTEQLSLPDAILLGMDPAASTVSVALPNKDVDALLPLLPQSLVYLVDNPVQK